jgi:hypothetical protein
MTRKQDSILVRTISRYIQKDSCVHFAHRLVILKPQGIITMISKINSVLSQNDGERPYLFGTVNNSHFQFADVWSIITRDSKLFSAEGHNRHYGLLWGVHV